MPTTSERGSSARVKHSGQQTHMCSKDLDLAEHRVLHYHASSRFVDEEVPEAEWATGEVVGDRERGQDWMTRQDR